MFDTLIRPGVGQYINDTHALAQLDTIITPFQHPVIITGKKAYHAFTQHYTGNRHFEVLFYDHSCSHEDIQRLCQQIQPQCDLIIGVGGGKALDTAKGVAHQLNVEYLTIPTVLGTCAACTPLSVIYNIDHAFKTVDYYQRAAYACLVDYSLLLTSPLKYFSSGIADTLAKWYEGIALANTYPKPWPVTLKTGIHSAQLAKDTLLTYAQESIQSVHNQTLNFAFKEVVDCILLIASNVGGFAVKYGRIAGAHAVHNGLTFVKETAEIEHGLKVAYGILVQLMSEQQVDEIQQLLPFYHAMQFPTCFKDLNITDNYLEKMTLIATHAAKDFESYVLMNAQITPPQIIDAMQALEQLSS